MAKAKGRYYAKMPDSCDLRSFVAINQGIRWILKEMRQGRLKPTEANAMRGCLTDAANITRMELESRGEWEKRVRHSGQVNMDVRQRYNLSMLSDEQLEHYRALLTAMEQKEDDKEDG